jgi:hypothetical protein
MGRVWFLILWAGQALALSPDSIWTRRYGGSNYDNTQGGTPDQSGGFVMVGQTQSFGPTGSNGYLLRVNGLTGDTVFTKWFGGFLSDQLADVHVTPARMLAVGSTSSFGTNPQNAWLVCTNANGDTNWTRTIDLGGTEAGLAVDFYADYFVAGWAWPSGGQPDVMVAKVSTSGTVLWTRTLGGSAIDMGYDVLALPDGGCVVVGETYNVGIGAPPFSNAWMIRYDSAGDTLWTKTFGDSAYYDAASEIIATADGGFMLAGRTEYYTADQDIYLIKTDADGNLEWSRTYGGGADDVAMDIVETCDSGFLLGGATQSFGAGDNDFYLIRTDAAGDTLWTSTYGGSESDFCYAVSAQCVPNVINEGYFAGGFTQSGSSGSADSWLVRLDAESWIEITNPSPCAEYVIGSTVTITWNWEGLTAHPYVSVELNRDFPSGTWETISASLYNVGFAQFTATGPASPRCRARVTKLAGSPAADVSNSNFQIIPLGNFQYPLMEWDSIYNGGAGLPTVIISSDGNYVSNYGRSIIKRDSVGGEIWTANFAYNTSYVAVVSGTVAELANGDFVAVGTLDSNNSALPDYLTLMRANSVGDSLTGHNAYELSARTLVGRDIIADESGVGFWALASSYAFGNTNFGNKAAILRSPGSNVVDSIQTEPFDAVACELIGNDQLLIAGETGDYFLNTRDLMLVKIEGNGDTLWTRRHDLGQNERVDDICRLASGSYAIAGSSFPWLGGPSDFLVVIVDADGQVIQSWNYDDFYNDYSSGIVEDADGGLVVSGVVQDLSQPSRSRLMKFGCDGALLWRNSRSGNDGQGFTDCAVTPGGEYIASGYHIVPSGGGGFASRPVLTKYGSESWTSPPTCPKADSLVIKFNPAIPANILTWQGEETGSYQIFSKTVFDTTHGSGNGWTEIGCVEPSPPARSSFSFTDTNLTPLRKFYYVVHNCSGGCGGGED